MGRPFAGFADLVDFQDLPSKTKHVVCFRSNDMYLYISIYIYIYIYIYIPPDLSPDHDYVEICVSPQCCVAFSMPKGLLNFSKIQMSR